ncbi:hypothetical protein HAX54_021923, partial [Datura stramonium]|nr:hypothetical protein [Datura stramonium]
PYILVHLILVADRDIVDSERSKIKFRVNDEKAIFAAGNGMKLPKEYVTYPASSANNLTTLFHIERVRKCTGRASNIV